MICRKLNKVVDANGDLVRYELAWFGSFGKQAKYVLLTVQPSDWTTNYTKYYKKVDGEYVQNDISTWATNTFYELKYVKKECENYSEGTQGVIDSLIQRLSVIRGELWAEPTFGIPLFKNRDTAIIDSDIIETITTHKGVKNLLSYKSWTEKNSHYFTCKILTIYGDVTEITNK